LGEKLTLPKGGSPTPTTWIMWEALIFPAIIPGKGKAKDSLQTENKTSLKIVEVG
jgi:hypothetical protein